jgi:hypothetical protein
MQGAGGGASTGKRNGNYRHGRRSKEAVRQSIGQPIFALGTKILVRLAAVEALKERMTEPPPN